MKREENFVVGQKVCKISGKPTLTFIEDDSEGEAFRCKIFIE